MSVLCRLFGHRWRGPYRISYVMDEDQREVSPGVLSITAVLRLRDEWSCARCFARRLDPPKDHR